MYTVLQSIKGSNQLNDALFISNTAAH